MRIAHRMFAPPHLWHGPPRHECLQCQERVTYGASRLSIISYRLLVSAMADRPLSDASFHVERLLQCRRFLFGARFHCRMDDLIQLFNGGFFREQGCGTSLDHGVSISPVSIH